MSRILIIDDNARYRAGLITLLQLENYVILEAENGELGLQMIHQYAPSLILCDVDMPVMNGIEVLRRAKSDLCSAQIPFIIITGQSDELTQRTVHDLGVEAYLIKTVSITTLLSTIAYLLSPKTSVLAQG